MQERIGLNLAKGAVYTYASMVLLKVLLLLNSVIIARWLGPENLGIYSIFSQIQNFVLALGLFGIPIAVSKFVAEYEKRDRASLQATVSTLLAFSLLTSAAAFALLLAFSETVAKRVYGEPRLIPLLRTGAFIVFFSLLGGVFKSILQGFQKIRLMARINVALGLVSVAVTMLMVIKFKLMGAAFRDLIVAAATCAVFLAAAVGFFPAYGLNFRLKLDRVALSRVLGLAVPLFLGSILISSGDLFIKSYLALTCGFEKSGMFLISDNFFQIIYFVPQAIAVPFLPIITGMHCADRGNFAGNVSKVVKLSGSLVLPVTVALGLLSGPAVSFLYGDAYAESRFVVFLMIFSAAAVSPAYVLGQALVGAGLGRQLLGLSAVQALINVTSAYYLVGRYGLNGLGAAFLISCLFNYLLSGFYSIKRLGLKPSQMHFGRYQLSLLGSGLAAYLIISCAKGPLFPACSAGLVAALAVFEYLSLEKDEKELLMEITCRIPCWNSGAR